VFSTGVRAGEMRGVSSENHVGSCADVPYTSVEDFTTTLRTVLPGADAAAKRFMVPMTLISCIVRDDIDVESTTRKVCTTVSTFVAFTMRARIE
jgi:hypothetical protein